MLVYFRIFIWLLCMELQWSFQTSCRISYSRCDLENVRLGLASEAVIEVAGSMHISRECVSSVQNDRLLQASFC